MINYPREGSKGDLINLEMGRQGGYLNPERVGALSIVRTHGLKTTTRLMKPNFAGHHGEVVECGT